jgi:Tle cognate immunity protein 4 C-terminal domain
MQARWALMAILAMGLVACGSSYKNKDYAAMNKIPVHSVCVGRMLVDLPKGGRMDWQQQFDYADVSKLPISTKAQFDALVAERKGELEKPEFANPHGRIVNYEPVGDNAVLILFRPKHVSEMVLHIDRYLWTGHWGYRLKTGALLDDDAKSLIPRIQKTLSQLEPINNYDPPPQAGFCIDGALVTGKIGPIWSSPTVTIGGWKDVYVNVIAHEDDGSRPVPSWQQGHHASAARTPYDQLDGIKSWAAASGRSSDDDRVVSFEILRKRDKPLAGMDGQEIAVKAKLANGQEWYRFEWGSVGNRDRRDKSGFNAFLEAGDKDYTPNYSAPPPEQDLLALWDAMLGSLKPRSGTR